MTMKPKIIKTAAENERALARISDLMAKGRLTKDEGDELDLLALLSETYELEHYPMPMPDVVDMVKFVMEQKEYTRKDLAKELAGASRACEFLSRKRPLSANSMRNLHKHWKIPADVVLG